MAHDRASNVVFENQDPLISSGTMVKLRWSPQSILPIQPADSYTVDIKLREYNNTSKTWKFTDIARDVPNTGYIEVAAPEMVPSENYNESVTPAVIQIGISETSSELQVVKRGFFSKLFKGIKKAIISFTKRLK